MEQISSFQTQVLSDIKQLKFKILPFCIDISSKCSTDLKIQIGHLQFEPVDNCVNIVDDNGLNVNKISDFVENTAKDDERKNTTVKKSPSANLMESEQYYFLELMDISENDGGKINVNPTECDNDAGKNLKEGKI